MERNSRVDDNIDGMGARKDREGKVERKEKKERKHERKERKEKDKKKQRKEKSYETDESNKTCDESIHKKRKVTSHNVGIEIEEYNDTENSTTPVAVIAGGIKKLEFFANLVAQELKKPGVGTMHAVGKKDTEINANSKPGDWNCQKCSTKNFREATQCTKCKAMKRMTVFR
jgi:hypothetical protein